MNKIEEGIRDFYKNCMTKAELDYFLMENTFTINFGFQKVATDIVDGKLIYEDRYGMSIQIENKEKKRTNGY